MDKKDAALLVELDTDPRIPTTVLAKRLRISQQVANYRLNRLREEGVIVKCGTIIDPYRLGLQQYRIFLRLHEQGHLHKEKIFGYLRQNKQVYWAGRVGGKYDLVIVVAVLDYPAFDAFLDNLYAQFPSCFRDYLAIYVLCHELYGHKHLGKRNHPGELLSYGTGVPVETLDELDWKIVDAIKDDCRLSALSLGQRFGSSYKTIQNRITGLERSKVIVGRRLFISDGTQRFILLFSYHEHSRQKERRLLAQLREEVMITQTIVLFGQWRLFLHIRANTLEDVQALVIRLREQHPFLDEHDVIPVFEDIRINLLPHS